MPSKKPARAGRSFISAEKGAEYASYDLSGQQQRTPELYECLNQQSSILEQSLTTDLRRLLNHDSLQVSVGPWTMAGPDQASFWLKAFPANEEANAVLLGMDRRSMFSLSELFFGGEPQKLTDKQIEKRHLADTERRLTNRLFEMVLRTLCPALGYSLDSWQSDWMDAETATISEHACWSEVTATAENWKLTIHLAWPIALSRQSSEKPDIDRDALKSGLRRALRTVKTRLTVKVASMELPLGELSSLKAGDILPMDLAAEVSARSGDTDCIKGTICENGDQLALRITRHVGVRNE